MSGQLSGSLSVIVSTFILDYGFKKIRGKGVVLEGTITVNGVNFEIEISDIDPLFKKPPVARLLTVPSEISSRAPHIEQNNKLCYLDPDSIFLDPLEPRRTTKVIMECIKTLLESLTNGNFDHEYAREFTSYWHAETRLFLITKESLGKGYRYTRKSIHKDKEYNESVVVSDTEMKDWWFEQRNSTPYKNEDLATFGSVYIRLNKPPIVLKKPFEWPIKSLKSVLEWLQNIDPSTEQKLLHSLRDVIPNHRTIAIIFDSHISGAFGVEIDISKTIQSGTRRFRLKSGQRSISKRQRSRKKKGHNTAGMKEFRRFLRTIPFPGKFKRLSIEDATEEFVIDRNLVKSATLNNKKIALIGCGTVGGFTADLLVKAGAGCGSKACLTLFDDDELSSGNLGRHILGIHYIHDKKGPAMADYLSKNSNTPSNNISGHQDFDTSNINSLKEFDLIIDVTGNENFSTRLAYECANLRREGKWNVPIIHCWVDAGGKAVRALLDDGKYGCYRCLNKETNNSNDPGELEERFPLYKNSSDEYSPARIQRCGDSYMPFSAGISFVAAGIVQEMSLQAMAGNFSPRFRHYGLDPTIRETKSQNIQPMKDCLCCQRLQ